MGWLARLFKKEWAIIKNDDGFTVAKVKLKDIDAKFEWNGGTYVIDRQSAHRDMIKGVIVDQFRYFYNVNNPMPLAFNKSNKLFGPMIDPKALNIMMEAEVLKKLNTVDKGLFANIKPQHLIIGAIAVIAIYVMYSKGMLG